MNDADDVLFGMFVGAILTFLIMFGAYHIPESDCQFEHNVADCEWVLQPTQIEAKVPAQ